MKDGVQPVNDSVKPGVSQGNQHQIHELGAFLRKTRESKHIMLDDVVDTTKIRSRYLQAIEEGKWDDLPSEVYARGFVRSYADFLGLQGQQIVTQFLSPSPNNDDVVSVQKPKVSLREDSHEGVEWATPVARPLATKRPNMAKRHEGSAYPYALKTRDSNRMWVVIGIIAVVVVLLIILLVLFGLVVNPSPKAKLVSTSTTASSASVSSTKASQAKKPSSTTKTKTGSMNGGHSSKQPSGTPVHQPSHAVTTLSLSKATPGETAYRVHSNHAGFSVTIHDLTSTCWMQITANGSMVKPNLLLSSGQSYEVKNATSVKLFVGANSHIQVYVNNKAVSMNKATGVYTYLFTRA